jgi:hypothetical protein
MDVLVLENFVLKKEQMSRTLSAEERTRHLSNFEPD